MRTSLARLLGRTMTLSGTLADGPVAARPRRASGVRLYLTLIAGILAIIAGSVGIGYYMLRPATLRIAVGPANSEDAKVINALAQALLRERGYTRLRIVPTDGAVASANLLGEGKADLAVIRGDLDVPKNAEAVATLRKNVVMLWVPPAPRGKKAAKITKISQLAGKRIGVIGRTPANVNLLKVILNQYAVGPAKVDIVQFSTSEVADAVRAQKVDVMMAAGPVNSRITADAFAASMRNGGTAKFLEIDSADAIASKFAQYEADTIPAGTFGGSPAQPEDEVKTINFSHYIVARASLSELTVGAFTRQLFAVRQALIAEVAQAAKIETPDTDKDAAIPAHPGAAAYVDGDEKTFLDRYSDYIWWSIMALSALGSAGAWFGSYLKRDERMVSTTLRDRLMDMLLEARNALALEQLEKLQAEADDILKQTLHCYDDGAIDDGALNASHIMLQQLHIAIADRRVILLSAPVAMRQTAALRA
jgi:TRAP transporter TAXI family solute receptor